MCQDVCSQYFLSYYLCKLQLKSINYILNHLRETALLTMFHQHLIRVEWAAQSHHGLVQNKIWRLEIELGGIQKSECKNIISFYCSAVCLNLIKLMVISVEHAK